MDEQSGESKEEEVMSEGIGELEMEGPGPLDKTALSPVLFLHTYMYACMYVCIYACIH